MSTVARRTAPPDADGRPPRVAVVIVNYNGADMLRDVLDSLRAQTFDDVETVVVDNGSADGSAELVRRGYPEVRLVALDENLGFAGGNNAGIRATHGEYVALLNNDAVADPGWLEELVRTADADLGVAAVTSKILFFTRFVPVRLEIERPAGGGAGTAAFLVGEASRFEGCGYAKPIFAEGFGPPETVDGRPVRCGGPRATVYLPVERADGEIRLVAQVASVGGAGGPRLGVAVGGTPVGVLDLEPELREHRVAVGRAVIATEAFDVVNNAGTTLSPLGDAADRGIWQPDRGQFDHEEDVDAFCGAAVLLRRSALDEVGLLDDDFFMYYEDTDLSWRLRARGWRIRYQPLGVVRHRHAASSEEWSPLFTFHTARNRVLMILNNGGLRATGRVAALELRAFASLLRQRWAHRSGPGSDRARQELATRLGAYRSLLRLAPRALRKRRGAVPHGRATDGRR